MMLYTFECSEGMHTCGYCDVPGHIFYDYSDLIEHAIRKHEMMFNDMMITCSQWRFEDIDEQDVGVMSSDLRSQQVGHIN